MLPSQKNKVDLSTLTDEEKKLFQLYGKLPAKKTPMNRMQERKYFDSGDYALSKAGKATEQHVTVGTAIPKPDTIPHASPPPLSSSPTLSSSPVKDSIMGTLGSFGDGITPKGGPPSPIRNTSNLSNNDSALNA